jgi:hypothetical protein
VIRPPYTHLVPLYRLWDQLGFLLIKVLVNNSIFLLIKKNNSLFFPPSSERSWLGRTITTTSHMCNRHKHFLLGISTLVVELMHLFNIKCYWYEPRDHMVMQPIKRLTTNSRKRETCLIGVWNNRNISQGSNTIGIRTPTIWISIHKQKV